MDAWKKEKLIKKFEKEIEQKQIKTRMKNPSWMYEKLSQAQARKKLEILRKERAQARHDAIEKANAIEKAEKEKKKFSIKKIFSKTAKTVKKPVSKKKKSQILKNALSFFE